jgi:DNA processing protein
VRLNAVPFFSPDKIRSLLGQLPAERALEAPVEFMASAMGVAHDRALRFRETARAFDADGELRRAEELGVSLHAWDDPGYPHALSKIPDAPLLVYVQGEPEAYGPAVAVVGSRTATPYGLRQGRRFGAELARAGALVVSGLARGVDSQAHEGALAADGRTWAVLGCGLARLYPPENDPLARRIVDAGGCLLSEFPLDGYPDKAHFIRRNRIISGLCWATVVVEGRGTSGSLVTAHCAQEQHRELFAVPGPADSPLSEGPHELLRLGAKVACSAADVLRTLPAGAALAARASGPRPGSAAGRAALSLEYRKILKLLVADAVTVDALAEETGIAIPHLVNILFEMELQGLVRPFPGQRYGKKDSY